MTLPTERDAGRPLRVGLVGARQAVQGIGAFVAREFARAGCEVVAVVGTSQQSVAVAREDLAARFGLRCAGYTDTSVLLAQERPDVLAICSPAAAHRAQLDAALAAGVHVFCEKPLWWEESTHTVSGHALAEDVTALALDFAAHGRLLGLNTQWPSTLPCYRRLYPEVLSGPPPWPVTRFEMLLSPVRNGEDLVVDGAPHLISMLQALLGHGSACDVRADWPAGDRSALDIRFGYAHARGVADVVFRLRQCPNQPRPAGYGINGGWAERQVSQPGYRMELVGDGRREALHDPLDLCVADFVAAVRRGAGTDVQSLVESMTVLRDLVAAAEQHDRPPERPPAQPPGQPPGQPEVPA